MKLRFFKVHRPAWPGEMLRQFWLRVADTGLIGYRHRLQPQGFQVQQAVAQQWVLDLDRLQLPEPCAVDWVSHPYRQSDLPDYPCIETWAIRAGASVSQAAAYRRIQFHSIRKARRKPSRLVQDPLAVLPHLTSHFGHWVGDHFGALLWFARNRSWSDSGRCLLAMAPSKHWADLLQSLCPPDSLRLVTPSQWNTENWHCSNAVVLPRLSSWQNLALARDALAPALEETSERPREKLFLCSMRSARIANLDEVCRCFVRYGYSVVNPVDRPVLPLLQRLRQATELWCEHGSMVLNLLLCRTQPYRLFELDPVATSNYSLGLTALGGSSYNAFQRGLYEPFYCLPAVQDDDRVHPYQRQLWVDVSVLEQTLDMETRRRHG